VSKSLPRVGVLRKSRSCGASLKTQGSQRTKIFSFLLITDSRKAEEGRKEKDLRYGNMSKTWLCKQKQLIENNIMLAKGFCFLFSSSCKSRFFLAGSKENKKR
jgi:hypothetical protein